jgi:hypothetical protein
MWTPEPDLLISRQFVYRRLVYRPGKERAPDRAGALVFASSVYVFILTSGFWFLNSELSG